MEVIITSVAQVETLNVVSELIEQFDEYEDIFTPVFLQYNGSTRNVSLQYRLRIFKDFMDREKFIESLIDQYLKNPILIPSNLYKIHIYDRATTDDLALNKKYITKVNEFNAFNLINIFKIESDYIDIHIDSNFKINFESLISSHISIQPKYIDKYVYQYELTSLLKNNQLPENFRCLNIPLTFNVVINRFLEHFIQKKFLKAHSEWYKLERKRTGSSRKKNLYSQMIYNKYGISPLEFNSKISSIIDSILNYIQNNYQKVIGVTNLEGIINVKSLEGLHFSNKDGSINEIRFSFETDFDNNNFATHSLISFNFKWMKSIFKRFLPIQSTY